MKFLQLLSPHHLTYGCCKFHASFMLYQMILPLEGNLRPSCNPTTWTFTMAQKLSKPESKAITEPAPIKETVFTEALPQAGTWPCVRARVSALP
jgi:hypothetical protein